jgi:multicomponent Na+:H+ antiporter subunit E
MSTAQVAGFARRPLWKVMIYAAVLAATWYVLSGKFDLLHFGTGVVTAFIIAMRARSVADGTRFHPIRFLMFVPWLTGQVLLSNLRVARIVLSADMNITPTLVRKPPRVTGDRALAMLGTSTTLTPGTLTVDVGPDEMLVHALDRLSADDVRRGVMAHRVSGVFGQDT